MPDLEQQLWSSAPLDQAYRSLGIRQRPRSGRPRSGCLLISLSESGFFESGCLVECPGDFEAVDATLNMAEESGGRRIRVSGSGALAVPAFPDSPPNHGIRGRKLGHLLATAPKNSGGIRVPKNQSAQRIKVSGSGGAESVAQNQWRRISGAESGRRIRAQNQGAESGCLVLVMLWFPVHSPGCLVLAF